MYLRHFAFTRLPFENDLATDELFQSNAHREADARLRHLIELRGIGLLTGEVGSGKTTVCRHVTAGLHPGLHRVYYVSLTTGNVLDMYKSNRRATHAWRWSSACPPNGPAPPPTAPSATRSPDSSRRPSSCRC